MNPYSNMYNKFSHQQLKMNQKNSRNNLSSNKLIAPLKKNQSLNLNLQKISKNHSKSLSKNAKMLVREIRKNESSRLPINNVYSRNYLQKGNRKKNKRINSYSSIGQNNSHQGRELNKITLCKIFI